MKCFHYPFQLLLVLLLTACGGGSKAPSEPLDPPANPDVWTKVSPESVGMSSSKLSAAFDEAFTDGTYTQAALVIKDGRLVYERYRGIRSGERAALESHYGPETQRIDQFYGDRDRFSLATSWSTGKSFTSVLVGIAIEQGYIESLEQSASVYIKEWAGDEDPRKQITIRNLLDMRSGLELICYDLVNNQLDTCSTASGAGGDLVFSDNQMDACINRPLAETGVFQPLHGGDWVYSNCDTMVLGEILYRATDQDLQTYADINLFSKIGMQAQWWRDFDESAQVNGNYLAYCCIDATPRDFAKFGQLLLNNGVWDEEQIIPRAYIEKIKNITNDSVVNEYFSYGLKFWTVFPQSLGNNVVYPPANKLYATKGFDGQYIVIDYDNNMIVVRNSIYTPALNLNDQRRMKVNASDLANTNFTATLPAGISMATQTDFNLAALLYGVKESINP
jgi:CubicO group peptidase (beta-lactamase class C family)